MQEQSHDPEQRSKVIHDAAGDSVAVEWYVGTAMSSSVSFLTDESDDVAMVFSPWELPQAARALEAALRTDGTRQIVRDMGFLERALFEKRGQYISLAVEVGDEINERMVFAEDDAKQLLGVIEQATDEIDGVEDDPHV